MLGTCTVNILRQWSVIAWGLKQILS